MTDKKLDYVERNIYYKIEMFKSFLESDMGLLEAPKADIDTAIHSIHNDIRSLDALTEVLRTYREFKKYEF